MPIARKTKELRPSASNRNEINSNNAEPTGAVSSAVLIGESTSGIRREDARDAKESEQSDDGVRVVKR